MKKVLLLTGALLGIGALASCGKQAKNVDLSIKEMDDKFKLPSDLLNVDSNYAEFATSSARANLSNPTVDAVVPRKTVFEEASNINVAINSGKLRDYVPGRWGQDVSIVTKDKAIDIPIDTTDAYKYRYVESLTLFDDLDLTEYTINANRRYVTRDGGELNYKTTEGLYNFWPEKTEGSDKYHIQNYVKENKSKEEGTFDYNTIAADNKTLDEAKTLIRQGVAENAANMYLYILNGNPGKTEVQDIDFAAKVEEAALAEKIKTVVEQTVLKNNGYVDQYKYYTSKDYNSIYAFQSVLTGSNYVFPSSSSSSMSRQQISGVPNFNDIIPVYSVRNMVAKVSRFGKGLTDWRVDYVGMYGKTYATKDDNLVTFDKPRCISSEYWFTSSTYDKVTGGVIPEIDPDKEYKTKGDLDAIFNGFAGGIYSFDWDYENEEKPDYNLDNPDHKVSYLLSDIRGVKEDKIKKNNLIAGGFDFSLSDKTMEGSADLKEGQYLFSGIWDPSSAILEKMSSRMAEKGHTYGKGMILKALTKDQTSIETDDIIKADDTYFMNPSELTVYNKNLGARDMMISEGYYTDGDEQRHTIPYVISGAKITDGAFNIDIVLEITNDNKVDIVSVTLDEIEDTGNAGDDDIVLKTL